jgi:DNA-binding NtrC family response regulator
MSDHAQGAEVLVVDGDDKVQRGLQQLLSGLELVPTVLGDPQRARELVREKYFAAALIDLDTPSPNAGLELVTWMKEHAPATSLLVMVSRKVFETSVEAFRAGALDVIVKSPDQIEHLKRRTLQACTDVVGRADEARLIQQVLELHDDMIKRMMEMSRHATDLEERIGGGAHDASADGTCSLLVVEEDAWLAKQLETALKSRGGYALTHVGTGGEALDKATAGRFQLALVRDQLPDLPGSMVVSTIKSQSPEIIAILFTRPGSKPGKAEVVEGSRVIQLVPQFSDANQMVERIDELRQAFVAKARERRYLGAFRQQNYDILKRYAELKQKVTQAASKSK